MRGCRAGAFVVGIQKTPLGADRRLRAARRPISLHARFAAALRRRRRARRQPAGALAAAAPAGRRVGARESLRACGASPLCASFLPLLLLAAIHGTFLSQQLWGSTYGIWPLLILLLAELLAFLGAFTARANVSIAGSRPRWPQSFPSRFWFAEASTPPAKSGSPTPTFPTAPRRTPRFPRSRASPRPARICRKSTNCCATPRPTFPSTMESFQFPEKNRSISPPAARRSFRAVLRSHHRSVLAERDCRSRSGAQHSLADCEDRCADQRRPHARPRGIDAAADAGVHARGALARLRCVSGDTQRASRSASRQAGKQRLRFLASLFPTASTAPSPSPSGRHRPRQSRRSLQRNGSPVPM